MQKKIQTALISVFNKDGIAELAQNLHRTGIQIISTGGTAEYLNNLGIPVTLVENITKYPSILGGRVKTLHPKIFGGILSRRDNSSDQYQIDEMSIQNIDLVVVDLYPFQETWNSGASQEDIIEKIDIGGVSLIRAAAKNFKDVVVLTSTNQYCVVTDCGFTTGIIQRAEFAKEAFRLTSSYDTAINSFMEINYAGKIHHN